jgi:hypothetical protein
MQACKQTKTTPEGILHVGEYCKLVELANGKGNFGSSFDIDNSSMSTSLFMVFRFLCFFLV